MPSSRQRSIDAPGASAGTGRASADPRAASRRSALHRRHGPYGIAADAASAGVSAKGGRPGSHASRLHGAVCEGAHPRTQKSGCPGGCRSGDGLVAKESPLMLDTLGVIYTQVGDYGSAKTAFRQAAELAPAHALYRYNLATASPADASQPSCRTAAITAVAARC